LRGVVGWNTRLCMYAYMTPTSILNHNTLRVRKYVGERRVYKKAADAATPDLQDFVPITDFTSGLP
jgi:hypothetical protein